MNSGAVFAVRSVGLLASCLCALACLTERDAVLPPPPRVDVTVRELAAAGSSSSGAPAQACTGEHIDVVEGRVPPGMIKLADVVTQAHEPWLSLKAHENAVRAVLEKKAARTCAEGISVLSATENGKGVQDTVMVLWRKPRENESARVVDDAADAGVWDGGIDVQVETGL